MCCCTCPPPEPYAVNVVPFPEAPSNSMSELSDMTVRLDGAVMQLHPQLEQLQALMSAPRTITIEPPPLWPSAFAFGLTLAVLSVVAVAAIGIGIATRRATAPVSPVLQAISTIDALSDEFLADVARLIRHAARRR